MAAVLRTRVAWILALFVSLGTADLPHLYLAHHDSDFDVVVTTAHDASAHRLDGAPEVPATRDHCLACHWGRSFSAAVAPAALRVPSTQPVLLVSCWNEPRPRHRSVSRTALRAPPAAPALV